jgi:hypothetical protein
MFDAELGLSQPRHAIAQVDLTVGSRDRAHGQLHSSTASMLAKLGFVVTVHGVLAWLILIDLGIIADYTSSVRPILDRAARDVFMSRGMPSVEN